MNAQFSLIGVTITALTFVSAIRGAEPTKNENDLARLQGKWTARAGARKEVRVLLEIKGRQATASIKTPHGMRLLLEGEIKLDESTSPRQLDWINFTGADQQEFPPLLAIYSVAGDRFTVCNGGMNGARPTKFKAGDGILAEVVVFERVPRVAAGKAKAAADPSATTKR
jgi:uncharacterized protein (TIGR03067 family)